MFTNAPVVTDVAVVVTVLSVLTVGVVNVVKVVVLSVTQQTHAGKVVRCTATIAIERKSLESNLKQIVVIFVIAIPNRKHINFCERFSNTAKAAMCNNEKTVHASSKMTKLPDAVDAGVVVTVLTVLAVGVVNVVTLVLSVMNTNRDEYL